MKSVILLLIGLIFLLLANSCKDNGTGQEKPKEEIPYMTLSIGDVRQFYDDPEGVYLPWKVVDTTIRVDGQKVHEVEESIYLYDVSFQATPYYFITELNSVSYNTVVWRYTDYNS